MASQISTKLTYEDYCLIPDDGKRHEIIDGEHYVNPAPNTKHQAVLFNLAVALGTFVRQNGIGKVFFAPYDVVLSEVDVLQPDLLFIGKARMHLITEANLPGAPDLAVEVISESSRKIDEIIKRKRYELFGVAEYWVVDPVLDLVKIYRRVGDVFERIPDMSLETGGRLTSPLLPGFSLDLSELFS